VTALPSNGTILLADGVTLVHLGKTLTVRQLTTSSRGQRQRYSCADNKADYRSAAGHIGFARLHES
jgi:hypothetical protein